MTYKTMATLAGMAVVLHIFGVGLGLIKLHFFDILKTHASDRKSVKS